MKRGTWVTVVSGPHSGEKGEVVTLPVGKGDGIVVRRVNGYGFTCKSSDVQEGNAAATPPLIPR